MMGQASGQAAGRHHWVSSVLDLSFCNNFSWKRTRNESAPALVGVVEYLVAEVVELAGNAFFELSSEDQGEISCEHIKLALSSDAELLPLLSVWIGVVEGERTGYRKVTKAPRKSIATKAAKAAKPCAFGASSGASNAFGAPSGDIGAPSGGFGAPSGDFGAPSGDFGAPSGGFGAPSGGFGAPSGGFGAPSGGFGAPSGDFGAPSGGFGAPSGGFGAPSGGFGAPSGGFGAPSGGFGAPSGGFGAPSGGFGAPSDGYASLYEAIPAPKNPSEKSSLDNAQEQERADAERLPMALVMTEMGFPLHWCVRALRECAGGNEDDIQARAMDWLLNNGDMLGSEDAIKESEEAAAIAEATAAAEKERRFSNNMYETVWLRLGFSDVTIESVGISEDVFASEAKRSVDEVKEEVVFAEAGWEEGWSSGGDYMEDQQGNIILGLI